MSVVSIFPLQSRSPVAGSGVRRAAAPEKQPQFHIINRITLIGFIGNDAERKAANATNIAIFSLATKTSWKNDAGSWESRTEWHRCVAFGKLADFAGTLSKGAHVAVEGELRSHEYQRELAVGTQKTTLTQRVWEVRVDSVLKLDRAAKRETSDENQEEVPR